MKYLSIALLFFTSLQLNAQEVISQTQTIVQRDMLYFISEVTIKDNGTTFPDTLTNTYLIGDSTVTASKLFDLATQPQIQVANGMRKALQKQQANQIRNAIQVFFQQVTGLSIFDQTSNVFFNSLSGRYRVFPAVGSNFTANIIQLPSGRLRLERESDNIRWTLNPLSRHSFRLVNFDHDNDSQNDTFDFYWDGVSDDRKILWPTERVTGETGSFRIVKIQ